MKKVKGTIHSFLFWVVLLSLLPFSFAAHAQSVTYPVHATLNVLPPYSLYLSDYVSGSRERVIVTLLNRDSRYASMSVKLRLTVKGNGFSFRSRPYATVPPITLEPNVPYRLTIEELVPYFDIRNLQAEGLGGSSYLNGGRLPEGTLEFNIEVLEYHTSRPLSRVAPALFYLMLQKPPQLSLPFNNEVLSFREPLNRLFQWTPRHSSISRIEYEFVLKELWDSGMAPEAAFAYSPEILRERISTTSFLYGAMQQPLMPGRRYAWAVRVVAKDGFDDVRIFENDGLSEIRTFRLSVPCPDVTGITAVPERGYIRVNWNGVPEHLNYAVTYRQKGSEEWTLFNTTFPSATLQGGRKGYTYEYRIGACCEPDVPLFGPIHTVTMPSEDSSRLANCGILRPVDLSNKKPLESLSPGDYFMAGDFPITVLEVTGGNGTFTGSGTVNVPFLGNGKFKVVFNNVFINTDHRLISGYAETVYQPNGGGVANIDDIMEGGKEVKAVEGITKADLSADFVIGEDVGFVMDESSGRITVSDEAGSVIGYIETGGINNGGEASANNGAPPSVFPMTVKDKEGNLYQLDEAEGVDTGGDTSGGSRRAFDSNKKLTATPVGKAGDPLREGSVDYKGINDNLAEVVFTDTEKSRYAFDTWQDVYSTVYLIRNSYERIPGGYRVPAKLLPPGKSDRVGAKIETKDPSIDPEKVVFMTPKGTEFKKESYKEGKYVLTIVGGEANDGQEVYALYPKKEGGYYNFGKLLVVSYPSYTMKVRIVPVGKELDAKEFNGLKEKLRSIYGKVGINCEVVLDEVFPYTGSTEFFQKSSGLLSVYTDEMKALNRAYEAARQTEDKTSYLFILGESGARRDRNASGYMPRGGQFGYLFRKDFKKAEEFYVAAAHELGHGRLILRHPFANEYQLEEGMLPENLMDYENGTHLAKWQWDIIHDPGVVIRLFEKDEDGMVVTDSLFYRYQYNPYDLFLMFEKNEIISKEDYLRVNSIQKVAIDPGHGDHHSGNKQIDPGAVSDDDYEKDLALKISLAIRDRLLERNVNTLMTREDDVVVEGKRIRWRLEKVHNDSCDIFVSIHLNASTSKQANGFSVLYLEDDGTSKKLAEEIIKAQTTMSIRGNGLEKRPKTGATRVGVLCDFKGDASVLIEVGFISNQEDLELMKTKYKKIGIEIADGICEYIKKEI